MPSFRLDNKRALIVGSSSGIGIGCATALADAGASVVLAARRKDLLDDLKKIGFQAITYMPPRNSNNQLSRLRLLCKKYNFMEISGVDINSSRQSFNCCLLYTSPSPRDS